VYTPRLGLLIFVLEKKYGLAVLPAQDLIEKTQRRRVIKKGFIGFNF